MQKHHLTNSRPSLKFLDAEQHDTLSQQMDYLHKLEEHRKLIKCLADQLQIQEKFGQSYLLNQEHLLKTITEKANTELIHKLAEGDNKASVMQSVGGQLLGSTQYVAARKKSAGKQPKAFNVNRYSSKVLRKKIKLLNDQLSKLQELTKQKIKQQ